MVPLDIDPAPATSTACSCTTSTTSGPPRSRARSAPRRRAARRPGHRGQELDRFEAWRATRSLIPTIKALRAHVRRTAIDALGDTLGPRHDGDAEVEQALDAWSRTCCTRRRAGCGPPPPLGRRSLWDWPATCSASARTGEDPTTVRVRPPARDADTGSVTP
jgi:hypothetical protein